MNAATINKWIISLGQNYDELIAQGDIPDQPLIRLYPDCDRLDLTLEKGIEMTFWAETKRLEALFITLVRTLPSTIEYEGTLPEPYTAEMTQSYVHAIFGEPFEFKGPIKMPQPMGQTGGWESYRLDPEIYPGKKVVFQYTAAMRVKTLVFTLIDKGHD